MHTPPRVLAVHRLGQVSYHEAWQAQRRLAKARLDDRIPDTLLLLQHDPVVTYGRNAGTGSLLMGAEALAERGVELVETDRGGDATFHGPGQVVGYPIFKLEGARRDIRAYVRALEQILIDLCAHYGLSAGREAGAPGCWLPAPGSTPEAPVYDRKIAAIGCRFSRWITQHGFALNVNVDLGYFDLIVPCGLRGKGVASLSRELGRPVDVAQVHTLLVEGFVRAFGHEQWVWREGWPEAALAEAP